MNTVENSSLYKELDEKTKNAIDYIKKAAGKIITQAHIELIEETFDINSDMESWWYSYVMVMNCKSDVTQKLNEKYMDMFIKENTLVDIENKIIFRFETGEKYVA